MLLVASLLIVGAVRASRKRLLAPSPAPQVKRGMETLEAAARTLQALFVITALVTFTLTYLPNVGSTAMFWAFVGSMGIAVLAHLYLFFKKVGRKEHQ